MKIWTKEDEVRESNIDISKGIHKLARGDETIEEFFERCPDWDVKYCDFCEKKFHIFRDNEQLVKSKDIGYIKCDEYNCHSFICLNCAKQIAKILRR